ncbi:MAG: SdrD B-like domain-containing protein, partial [Pirellulales bacterium]
SQTINTAAGADVRIGSDFAGRRFDGEVRSVRVWNALLSDPSADMVDVVLDGTEANLVAAWEFDEPYSETVLDVSPNAFHGTLGDPALGSETHPVRRFSSRDTDSVVVVAEDPDGDALTLSVDVDVPEVVPLLVGRAVTFTIDPGFTGTARVTVTATDRLDGMGAASGRSATQSFDFTVGTPAIYGTKFDDLNQNGVQDPGEPGVEGVTVFNDGNGDVLLDASEPRTYTDANGDYALANVSFQTIDLPAQAVAVAPPLGFEIANNDLPVLTITAGGGAPTLLSFNPQPGEPAIVEGTVDAPSNGRLENSNLPQFQIDVNGLPTTLVELPLVPGQPAVVVAPIDAPLDGKSTAASIDLDLVVNGLPGPVVIPALGPPQPAVAVGQSPPQLGSPMTGLFFDLGVSDMMGVALDTIGHPSPPAFSTVQELADFLNGMIDASSELNGRVLAIDAGGLLAFNTTDTGAAVQLDVAPSGPGAGEAGFSVSVTAFGTREPNATDNNNSIDDLVADLNDAIASSVHNGTVVAQRSGDRIQFTTLVIGPDPSLSVTDVGSGEDTGFTSPVSETGVPDGNVTSNNGGVADLAGDLNLAIANAGLAGEIEASNNVNQIVFYTLADGGDQMLQVVDANGSGIGFDIPQFD